MKYEEMKAIDAAVDRLPEKYRSHTWSCRELATELSRDSGVPNISDYMAGKIADALDIPRRRLGRKSLPPAKQYLIRLINILLVQPPHKVREQLVALRDEIGGSNVQQD